MIRNPLLVLALVMFVGAGAFAQCTADFSYSQGNVFTFGFENLSLPFNDPNATYLWNFGDGDTSSKENPSHTYTALGSYVVCMTITSPLDGCNSTKCDTIKINCPAMAGFNYTHGTDYSYDFNYTSSSNDHVTWHWNFGDGDTSTSRTPSHTFAKTGDYHVCLTVTDIATHCTSDTCQYVSVCVAYANFTHSNSSKFNYSFTDVSIGEDASTTYDWHFGDGDTSTVKNPNYTFPRPGTYDVCLTIDVVDSGCTNQYCTSISVACQDSANFSYTNAGGLLYQFTDLSTGEDNSVTYSWSFGDGDASADKNPTHLFTNPDQHNVCLTIRNVDQGCVSTYCATLIVSCMDSAGFTYTNTGSTYHFTDASRGEDTSASFVWNFGDGVSIPVKNPSHTYTTLGQYKVCLTMTDEDAGCSSQYCENIDVTCPLATHFTYTSADSAVIFEDATTGEDNSSAYHWTFGDNDTSNVQNPTHVYAASNQYHVCLTVTDGDLSCSNQYCQDILVNINGCKDSAEFSYSNVQDNYSFQNISKNIGNSSTYRWTFGDGDSSSASSPSHTYTSSGAFEVCLVITDATNSCSSDECQTINVVSGINTVNAPANSIRVYPNPATGRVKIDLRGFEARNIILFNQLGEKILQLVPDNNGLTTVDVSALPAGIYWVSAVSDNEVLSTTLIVTGK